MNDELNTILPKVLTTKKQRERLRINLLAGRTINLQDTIFTFINEEQRSKFINDYGNIFNKFLDAVEYNGCGDAIINITTLALIWSENDNRELFDASIVDNKRYFFVETSCWDVWIKEK